MQINCARSRIFTPPLTPPRQGEGDRSAIAAGSDTCIPPIPSSCSRLPRARATACWPGWRWPACWGWCRRSGGWALVGFGLAFGLITVGLLSSTAHLGRPERAWRAFSQWRSSWLSREGVMAVATYVPAGLLALGWVLLERADGIFVALALLAAICAGVTLYTTGMIYASLRTIRQWYQPLTAPIYIALGFASGAVLLNLVLNVFGHSGRMERRAGDRLRRGSGCDEVELLARHRCGAAHLDGGGRHRPRSSRQGAAAGAAAHAAQLHHARDGLSRGAQARRQVAADRAAGGVRGADRRLAAVAGGGRWALRLRRSPFCRWGSAWSSNAGCSSPRPSTSSCCTTEPMRRSDGVITASCAQASTRAWCARFGVKQLGENLSGLREARTRPVAVGVAVHEIDATVIARQRYPPSRDAPAGWAALRASASGRSRTGRR